MELVSAMPGVEHVAEGVEGINTNPLTILFEVADSHPDRKSPLYYSLGYATGGDPVQGHEPLDVLRVRAHAHETDRSRQFLEDFNRMLQERFPGVITLPAKLLDTATAKRVYRWRLPLADMVLFAFSMPTRRDRVE